jgi:iron-sulfur cluster assembly protein
MSIQLTAAAAERVEQFMNRDDGLGMRLGVRRTGCSGWAYEVDIAREIGVADTVFEDQGVKVVVDQKSLSLVEGTEIDFVQEGLNRVFRFRNPNVVDECGCGESFTVG